MNDHRDHTELETRLRPWLQAVAPPASNDLTNRVLQRTAAIPQRRTWTMRFGLPALAVAAVATVAVVLGLQLGQFRPGETGPFGSDPSATATPSSIESTSAQPTPSPSAPVLGFYRCENGVEGYAVDVPQDWFANPKVTAPDGGNDIPACRYFAPAEFEVRPNSGFPPTVAIGFQVVEAIGPSEGTELRSSETTVDGHDALLREVEITEGGPFLPAGTRVYEVYVSLADGGYLRFSTDSSRDGDYEDHRAVMDQMMATLEILP